MFPLFSPCSFDRQRVVDRRERYRQVRAFLNSGEEISFEWHSWFASHLILHFRGGSMAEWFGALDLKSGGPWFKSSTLLLSGFVLCSPESNSSTVLCK